MNDAREGERTRAFVRGFLRCRGILDFRGRELGFFLPSSCKSGGNLSPFQNALLEGMRGIATRELRFKRDERDVGCVFRAMWRYRR